MKRQEIQSFGEAFNGKTPSKEEQRSSGLPILKIKDIDETGQFRGVFESFVDEAFYNRYAKKKLKTGDTIILNAAHNSDYVGSKNAFVPDDLNGVIATGEWLIVRVKEANTKYVNQYLKSPSGRKALKNCVKGIHLYPKDVERVSVPLPPLDDQIRIAHLLGKVEGLIAQRKQHLQQLDDLLKSVFLEMFGDPICNPKKFPVRNLSEFYINSKEGTKCGPFGSALKKDELVESGVPVWNMDNIDPAGRMVLPYRMWITEEKYRNLASYSVNDGDIIISRAGTVGKMCVARMNGQPAIISTNLIRLRLSNELRPLHFVSLMTYCKGRVGRLKTGADGALTHMNTGILDKLEFPYPPIELQDQFSAIVEKVESLKSRYQQSLTDLEYLYGALSQRAFKGELDLARVPLPLDNDEAPQQAGQTHEQQTAPETFQLPEPSESGEWLSAEKRQALIEFWLNAWFQHYVGEPFSATAFIDAASQRLSELSERDAFRLDDLDHGLDKGQWYDEPAPFSSAEYEQIKQWVFAALSAGKLKQSLDGNQIHVASPKRPADWGTW